MFLIIGLGNPGSDYKNTRHNVGFDMIDLLSGKYNININRVKFKGMYGEGHIGSEKVILLKPNTYMNLSGESAAEAVNFYKIPKENVIVIYDDISLETGRLRIRLKGSAGGHNGMKSIINHFGTDSFPRLKIGVGEPEYDMISHVLGKFTTEEKEKIDKVYKASVEAVEKIIKEGTVEAMNKFNGFSIGD